jgi:hypothetical protein
MIPAAINAKLQHAGRIVSNIKQFSVAVRH